METVVTLYCANWRYQNVPIQLFAELADVEPVEYPIPLGEEHGVQDSCMVVPIVYVDNQLIVCMIEIDLDATPADPFDHEVANHSGPDLDEVPDDIDEKDMNDDGNVNASSVGNPIRHIVIHNDLGAHILFIDPNTVHAAEFLEYLDILPAHQLAIDSKFKELFVGQNFEIKEECVFFIKRYSMNVLVDYKVVVLKLTLYIGEC
ncbi:hypothetical protein GOBAR_AA23865 [Gossypium barbadense]|uniref:Uncharacterized protein n=1 Tax=Gossypium barbadense TaxID=3634 RepID=A0A2P5X0D1_GOSBA|nr:hypothetical protein GOBAR_AA23865 [Gossypium barbadense]